MSAIFGSAIQFNAGGGTNLIQLDETYASHGNTFQVKGSENVVGKTFIYPGDRIGLSGLVDINLIGGNHPDLFQVPQLLQPIEVNLKGRGGEDRFEVGFSDSDASIDRHLQAKLGAYLVLEGGAATDTLVINDQDGGGGDYVISADQLTRKAGLIQVTPSIDYSDLDQLELTTSELAENRVRIDSFDGNIDLHIRNSGTIDLGAGADNRFAGRLESLHGVIAINAPLTAQIALNIYDQNDSGDDIYELNPGQFVKHQPAGDVTINYPLIPVQSLTLNAGVGNNRIDVNGNILVNTTLNGGAGNDTFRITPALKDPSSIITPVEIHGQGATDTLEIFDNADADSENYIITTKSVSREGGWSFDIGDFDILKLHTTDGENTFQINGTAGGVSYELFGEGGDDRFVVAQGSFDEDKLFAGPIVIDGGKGNHELLIDDQSANAESARDYFF